MKKRVILCVAIFCAGFCVAQDVISLKNGGRIEDVTIKSVTDAEIFYEQKGTEITIEKSEVSAILYEDGRYVEIKNAEESLLVNQNAYLLHGSDVTEDLAILGIFVDTANMAGVKGARQQMEYYYCLCIAKEDMNAYNAYLKEHKDIKKQYNKVFKDVRNYEAALQASRAYQALKANGASSEEACAALINTYIFSVTNTNK